MRDLVDVDRLAEHLHDDALVVVDASMAPPGSSDPVPAGGIPGAVRFDIEGTMSRRDDGDGRGPVGVHDMLAPADFERALRDLGIRAGDRVVAYDAAGMFSSARAWWMLRAAAIDAAVLDGGLPAGHIPGARSLHDATVAPGGRMRPVDELAELLAGAAGERPIVASCGSGVTASVLALAATLTGRQATVYDGSWSHWGRVDSGRPVATGD